MKTNPALYDRDCHDCLQFMYDEKTGKRVMRRGQPMPRPPGSVPCALGRCDKGDPDHQKVLTPANRAAYEHYLQCKAIGHFPDDPIVKRNAAAIAMAEEHVERLYQLNVENAALIALNKGGTK